MSNTNSTKLQGTTTILTMLTSCQAKCCGEVYDIAHYTTVEEIEALCSIYGDDWRTESETSRCYSTTVSEGTREVLLSVTLPPEYPGSAPPVFELSAPWMERKQKESLHRQLDMVYLDNVGETVIFQWIERIRETLHNINQSERVAKSKKDKDKHNECTLEADLSKLDIKSPDISHGEVITDRKSSFQGHAAAVSSVDEVNAVLLALKQNRKIAGAYHNMYAYRIARAGGGAGGGAVLQDCDDDGEAHAGGRLLHLLQILNQSGTVVVVSRWYGGIQLGPDRFRHINNAARSAIQQAGLLKN